MRTTVEELDGNKVKLSVEVESGEFETALDAAFKKIAKEVRLPGFRPGKAPRKVLEARLGKEFARGEALRDSVPEYYAKAVLEHEVDVIAAPEIDITGGEDDGDVAFDAVVEVRPQISVAGYNGLRVEVPNPEPTDEEVVTRLEALQRQFSELGDVERAAMEGDHVTIDISATYEDEPVDGLTADGYVYEVGTKAVVEELDEQLTGSKPGDILAFDADHPDDDEDGVLSFKVLVKGVQERVLPELDDDFAKEASEFDSLADLRDDARSKLNEMKRSASSRALRDKVAEALANLVDEDVPDALVDGEIENRIQELAMQLGQQGLDFDQFFEVTGRSREEFMEGLREPAERAAKVDLALRAVAAAEGFEPTDELVDAEISAMAEVMEQPLEKVRQLMADTGRLPLLKVDLAKRDALEFLMDTVEIVDEAGVTLDRADIEPEEDPADRADPAPATDEGHQGDEEE